LRSLARDLFGEGEDEAVLRGALPNRRGDPSKFHADIDRPEDRGAAHIQLVLDGVIAGAAFAVVIAAMQTDAHQHEPMDNADAPIVSDAAQPIEAFKARLVAHGRSPASAPCLTGRWDRAMGGTQ
jgi:hypothetical protein